MQNRTAVAMALVLVVGVGGFSVAPFAAATDTDCHENFDIAPSEALASDRVLAANGRDVGEASVLMVSGDADLFVELVDEGAAGELRWLVFHESGCNAYDQGGCDQDNVLTTKDTVSCTLNAPSSGSKSYWVTFEEIGGANAITYKAWLE